MTKTDSTEPLDATDRPRARPSRRAGLAGLVGCLSLARILRAHGQDAWPSRPVRVIVTYPPGGTADVTARILFDALGKRLGQPFVIDNRPGATGTVGAGIAVRAVPDGYTVLYDATGLSITPALFTRLAFDPVRDLVPVFRAAIVPQLLLVNASNPAKDLAGLIALAKAAPKGLDVGSSGVGSVQHLVLERFARAAGVTLNHVPYRGGAPALNDLLAGQIQIYFGNANVGATYARAGTLRALAHTGRGRLTALPEVPAISDTLPGFETYEWNGVFVPKDVPQPVIGALSAALNAVIAEPSVVEKMRATDLQFAPNTPAEFADFFHDQSTMWQGLVREMNLRLE